VSAAVHRVLTIHGGTHRPGEPIAMSVYVIRFMRCLFWLLAVLAFLRPAGVVASEQVIDVPLAQGASIGYLLTQQDGSQPHWILVMMPGSKGNLELSQQPDGAIRLREKNNFLIRARRLFVDDQFATAIVDAPSDQPGGYSDAFRASPRAAQDLAQVAADLHRRFPQAKLVLVGTSRGTISTAYAGRALPDVWDAVVHTSTLSSPSRGQATPLIGFDYGAIRARQLFVHHADDGCFLCSYEALRRIAESSQYALITVHGGDVRGEPCEALSHHGFYGKDEAVVAAIKAWISGQPWQDDVG
jgi:pimeloyl-ACP methyl ester carboxylesterase